MKNIILTFLLGLIPFLSYSQVSANIRPAAKLNVSNATGSDPYVLTVTVSDDLSRFTLADFGIGDSVYLVDGSDLLIYVVTAKSGSQLTVDDVNNTGISAPTGQGAIFKPTLNSSFPTYVAGLRDDLRSMIMNRFSQLIDTKINEASDVYSYVGGAGVLPAVNPPAIPQYLARNGANELYQWNGTAWVAVGGSGSTASNGLTKTGSDIQLGGALTAPTTITTDAVNTLAIAGLLNVGGVTTDSFVVIDPASGQLKKRSLPTSASVDTLTRQYVITRKPLDSIAIDSSEFRTATIGVNGLDFIEYYAANNGNNSYTGKNPIVPKLNLSSIPIQSTLDAKGSIRVGLKSNDVFREQVFTSTSGVKFNLTGYDLNKGSGNTLPKITASDIVTNWTFTSGNTYQASVTNFMTGNGSSDFDAAAYSGYDWVNVTEIDTLLEKALPYTSHKQLIYVTSQAAVDITDGSYFVASTPANPMTVYINPTGNGFNNGYRYEVSTRKNTIYSLNSKASKLENFHIANTVFGYGVALGDSAYVNKMLFTGGGIHQLVSSSLNINSSVFASGTQNVTTGNAISYGTNGGGSPRITNNIFLDARGGSVYSHSSDATNFPTKSLLAYNNKSWGDSLYQSAAFATERVLTIKILNNYTHNQSFAVGVSSDATIANNVFDNVSGSSSFSSISGLFGTKTHFYNNLVKAVSQNSNAGQIVIKSNRVTLDTSIINNNIFHVKHGFNSTNTSFANAITPTLFIGDYSTTSPKHDFKRNIIIVDCSGNGGVKITEANQNSAGSGLGRYPFRSDSNVYIVVGGVISWVNLNNGGSPNVYDLPTWQTQTGLDAHSIYIDLSQNAAGLKAIFSDPDNGNYTLRTDGQYYSAITNIKAGMITPPQYFPKKPTIEEAVNITQSGVSEKVYLNSDVQFPIPQNDTSSNIAVRPNGNTTTSTLKIGTKTAQDVSIIKNSVEQLKFRSFPRVISSISQTTGLTNGEIYLDSTNIGIGNRVYGTATSLSGNDNVAIGRDALMNTTGTQNIGIGYRALFGGSGTGNTAVGYGIAANTALTTGASNTLMGYNAANRLSTGNQNTIIGNSAGNFLADGSTNTVLGYNALNSNASSSNNVAIGSSALGSVSTAGNNVAVGASAGNGVNVTGIVALGHQAGQNWITSNSLAISNSNASNGSTTWLYGNSSYQVGIGTVSPTNRLTVQGANPIKALGFVNTNIPDSVLTVRSGQNGLIETTSLLTAVQRVSNSLVITQSASPSTGTTVTIAATTTRLLLQPSSVIATLTIAFPSSPTDGQMIRVNVGSTGGVAAGATAVTTATWSNGTIYGTSPVSLTGGDTYDFQWDSANSVWRRIIL